ncbi:MAG: DHHA1 domain-containing protein [Planctomycetota bacterium]|jgi:phosphoesterase RecJ-like protein|nr:DHHA1 domain-containing protein [Planctomycetota bacterium]MDP6942173.1 DHHA1 domain-containing protein [Planctomycetota bacterium]
METVAALLADAQRILITGHMKADGDCLGTESVLFQMCTVLGKDVRVVNPDPPDSRFSFLAEHCPFEVYQQEKGLPEFDLAFVCDCSVLPRLGELGSSLASASGNRVVVDHHPLDQTMPGLWQAMILDPTAAASGLLAIRFAEFLGVELPVSALEAAFAAIAADTGWFKYSNADYPAWECAAKLVEGGVVPDSLYRAIHQNSLQGHPVGIGLALCNVQYFDNGRIAMTKISQAELQAANAILDDTDEVLDILRAVKSVDAVAVLYEKEDGGIKASLRSKVTTDVREIASRLGGGGHVRASGVSFQEGVSLDEAWKMLQREFCA